MGLGWGGFDRAKLDVLMLIRIPFSFHGSNVDVSMCQQTTQPSSKVTWYDKGPCALRIVTQQPGWSTRKNLSQTPSPPL